MAFDLFRGDNKYTKRIAAGTGPESLFLNEKSSDLNRTTEKRANVRSSGVRSSFRCGCSDFSQKACVAGPIPGRAYCGARETGYAIGRKSVRKRDQFNWLLVATNQNKKCR